jgi:hypothetical protein
MHGFEGRALTGAWFYGPSKGGAYLKLQRVYWFGEKWNQPAVTIDAYLPQRAALALYSKLVNDLQPIIAVCTGTGSGIPTVYEMTDEFGAYPFVYGMTFLTTDVVPADLLDDFRKRLGPESVKSTSSGFLISRGDPPWTRKGSSEEEDELYIFVGDRITRVALGIYALPG